MTARENASVRVGARHGGVRVARGRARGPPPLGGSGAWGDGVWEVPCSGIVQHEGEREIRYGRSGGRGHRAQGTGGGTLIRSKRRLAAQRPECQYSVGTARGITVNGPLRSGAKDPDHACATSSALRIRVPPQHGPDIQSCQAGGRSILEWSRMNRHPPPLSRHSHPPSRHSHPPPATGHWLAHADHRRRFTVRDLASSQPATVTFAAMAPAMGHRQPFRSLAVRLRSIGTRSAHHTCRTRRSS